MKDIGFKVFVSITAVALFITTLLGATHAEQEKVQRYREQCAMVLGIVQTAKDSA